jgi:hypothetical protein
VALTGLTTAVPSLCRQRPRQVGAARNKLRSKLIVRFGSKADICAAIRHVRFTPDNDRESGFPQKVMSALPPKADMCGAARDVRFGPKADIQDARFEALKMYLLLLKKYLPATFKRSNSLCHSLRSLAETSSLPPTWFRTNCASPLL